MTLDAINELIAKGAQYPVLRPAKDGESSIVAVIGALQKDGKLAVAAISMSYLELAGKDDETQEAMVGLRTHDASDAVERLLALADQPKQA